MNVTRCHTTNDVTHCHIIYYYVTSHVAIL